MDELGEGGSSGGGGGGVCRLMVQNGRIGGSVNAWFDGEVDSWVGEYVDRSLEEGHDQIDS